MEEARYINHFLEKRSSSKAQCPKTSKTAEPLMQVLWILATQTNPTYVNSKSAHM